MKSKEKKMNTTPDVNENDLNDFFVVKNLSNISIRRPNLSYVKPVEATVVLFETNQPKNLNEIKKLPEKQQQTRKV